MRAPELRAAMRSRIDAAPDPAEALPAELGAGGSAPPPPREAAAVERDQAADARAKAPGIGRLDCVAAE
eukprot:7088113-Pyramimonas_sp.AAC.1